MVEYDLRKLRYYIFSLYNIHKDCVQTCKNIEILTNVPAFTLYDVLKSKIHIDSNDINSNFLSLLSKCIIVHIENEKIPTINDESNAICDFDDIQITSQTLKIDPKHMFIINNHQLDREDINHDPHSYVNNPSIFFNSDIGHGLKNFYGHFRIMNLLQNHRILIPVPVFDLSTSKFYPFLKSLDGCDLRYEPILKFTKYLLNKKYQFRQGDNLRKSSQIFIQCSGNILYNQIIKSFNLNQKPPKLDGNWSKMVIYRKFIFFKGRISSKSLLFRTIFESLDTDKATISNFLIFIIFNNEYFSENFQERKAFLNSFFDKSHSKIVKTFRHKSLLYGLLNHFRTFIQNVHYVDWRDKRYLNSKPLQGSSFNTVTFPDVYKYVKFIVGKTVPPELLCGKSNYLNFLKVCYSLITLNKSENISMSEVMKGFRIKHCNWIKSSYHSRGQTRTILEYLCRIIYFLLQYFIIPVIARHLYFTESGFSMYRIHYIRIEEWMKMLKEARTEYFSNGQIFPKLDISETFPMPRFIPKHHGMRPILNCNKSTGLTDFLDNLFSQYNHKYDKRCDCYYCHVRKKLNYPTNLNRLLKLIHQALTSNSKTTPILGNCVLGYNTFYKHLKAWWLKFTKSLRTKSDVKLYYFIADLSKFYERIPHDKLMEVLNQLPLVDSTFSAMYKRFFVKLASSVNSFARIEDVPSFSDRKLKKVSCRLYGNSVIASRFNSPRTFTVTKFDILAAVSSLISSQKLQLPNLNTKYIKLNRGIPQGCCISPFLSSLYLSNLDKSLSSHLQTKIFENNRVLSIPNFLVRWIDDFLFVSTNPEVVNNISQLLCSNSFGAMVNTQKIVTNTSIDEKSDTDINNNTLEWINCKFNFDIANRHINVELSPWKFSDIRIRDTISLSRLKTHSFMFSVIEQRLIGYIMNKLSHKTYTCTKINSTDCIISNSYIVMRTCSLKLLCSIFVLVENFGCFVNLRYFSRLMSNLITITSNLVSRGGLKIRKHNLREILMISLIYTFRNSSVNISKRARKSKYLRLINKKIIRKMYHHVNSLANKDKLFSFASKLEDKYRINWSAIL